MESTKNASTPQTSTVTTTTVTEKIEHIPVVVGTTVVMGAERIGAAVVGGVETVGEVAVRGAETAGHVVVDGTKAVGAAVVTGTEVVVHAGEKDVVRAGAVTVGAVQHAASDISEAGKQLGRDAQHVVTPPRTPPTPVTPAVPVTPAPAAV